MLLPSVATWLKPRRQRDNEIGLIVLQIRKTSPGPTGRPAR
jgi:hypothetical protein